MEGPRLVDIILVMNTAPILTQSFTEKPSDRFQPNTRNAFSLMEMIVVIAVITMLVSLLMPSPARSKYETRSTRCGSNKRQIAVGLTAYADMNRGWYPARFAQQNSYDHPFWWGLTNNANLDMHEVADDIFGGTGLQVPSILLCEISPTAVWGIDIPWPLGNIYRSNVAVTGGWHWQSTSPSACTPLQDLSVMPLRNDQAHNRPVAFDLIEYMTGNSNNGYTGWVIGHQYQGIYHYRSQSGTEIAPPDPIPFAYGDCSVRFTKELEPYYVDPGWGTKYWAAD